MNSKLIRVYKKLDIDEIKDHLMICGDLSASCSKCNCLSVKMDMPKCPECQTEFKYISFRNTAGNMPKILKLYDARLELIFVDFDDFKKMTGSVKAQEFFK